ncbi:type II toxin-antitoxin system VapC family toxin [Aquiflexum sp. LQ15W]|jgi:predicted nucleic acid-binding protein|uniref:type II toxin-antitoxin system VapC family toxin n=1 Tax=Cognataquiflexum nitidum TaxID=2922272 RepID=UPI001F13AAFE|nr:type II toxin-antitoxin system VapC family toxin [Cognataquiflexum nitidum]MCH6198205.1 type II toxin-antitoxin system VapC family toxin [Cognataquiflexum nitidum]
MEDKMIMLDTGILIEYFRKKEKSKSVFFNLTKSYTSFAVSILTKYEIFVGSNETQIIFWNSFFDKIMVIPFDENCLQESVKIYKDLKSKNKLIDIEDIFISGSAIASKLKIATLNKKHFERVKNIELISIHLQ